MLQETLAESKDFHPCRYQQSPKIEMNNSEKPKKSSILWIVQTKKKFTLLLFKVYNSESSYPQDQKDYRNKEENFSNTYSCELRVGAWWDYENIWRKFV